MTQDKPLLGITLMLGFCAIAPLGDAVAKILGQAVPLGIVLLMRFGVQALLLAPILAFGGRPWRMSGRVLRLTWLRTVMHIIGIGMMFTALQYLELADAVAIAFVMPFIMMFLGRFVLDEEVGARRLIAATVGFAGTLLVVQPSFTEVGWPALLPVGVALNFALFMLVTRQIAKDTDPIGLQTVSGAMAVAILAPVILLYNTGMLDNIVLLPPLPALDALTLEWPTPQDWGLLFTIGTLGTLAHLLMTWSLKYAPSATLAPMQYLEIPFATGLGWVIFSDLPNPLATLGIAITVAAGLYIVAREHACARRAGNHAGNQIGATPIKPAKPAHPATHQPQMAAPSPAE